MGPIDYIWFKKIGKCYEYELKLVDTRVNEFKCGPPYDEYAGNHLSDHFGVEATFNVNKKSIGKNCADIGGNNGGGIEPRDDVFLKEDPNRELLK